MEKPNLKRIYNLKKRSKRQEDKAFNLGDGYHADMPGSTPSSDRKMYRHMDRSERLDAKARELFKEKQNKKEMEDNPIKFVSPGMTPPATEGGFKMQMGSKENFSGTNFSSKDQDTMAAAPSIMKDDWGGETIEMKDQDGSPLNYGMRSQVAKKRKMSEAENLQEGLNTRAEDKRQSFNDILKVGNTVANLGATAVSAFKP